MSHCAWPRPNWFKYWVHKFVQAFRRKKKCSLNVAWNCARALRLVATWGRKRALTSPPRCSSVNASIRRAKPFYTGMDILWLPYHVPHERDSKVDKLVQFKVEDLIISYRSGYVSGIGNGPDSGSKYRFPGYGPCSWIGLRVPDENPECFGFFLNQGSLHFNSSMMSFS